MGLHRVDSSAARRLHGSELVSRKRKDDATAALSMHLDMLRFSPRMERFFERRGLTTVRDLVALAPNALLVEPKLGRKSVAHARAVLRAELQMSWEDLQRAAGFQRANEPADTSRSPEDEEWASLSVRIPDDVLDRQLAACNLPTRLSTFAARARLRTLRELLATPYAQIVEARGIGSGTLNAALQSLRSWCTPPSSGAAASHGHTERAAPSEPLPAGSHWKQLLQDAIRGLAPTDRLVVTQRSGLVAAPASLAETGESLGVSRERARQIETRALRRLRAARWIMPARQRLEALCPTRMVALASFRPGDDLFALSGQDVDSFAFFVNEVLESAVRVVRVADRPLLSRVKREVAERTISQMRAAAATLTFPIVAGGQWAALAARLSLPETEVRSVAPFLEDGWAIDGGQVRAFGTSRRTAVVSFVRAAGRPVTCSEIEERFGRGHFPDEIVFLDWGLLAHPEHIPDWDRWASRVPRVVRSILEREGPDRQWSTKELLPMLAKEVDLPAWMNEWALGSLLRDVPEVRYLGRNVVALPDAGEERLHVRELVQGILEEAGGPMLESELLGALTRSRGLGQHTWAVTRMRPPFVLFEDGRIGIEPRDVIGGASAIAAFREGTFGTLEARQKAINAVELRAMIARYGPWDARMARSLLRHDGRFRCTPGGAVALAEWEGARAPTQADVLRQLIIEHEGLLPVATAATALPTTSGLPLSRARIGLLASGIGARLAGAFIEWSSKSDAALQRAPAPSPQHATEPGIASRPAPERAPMSCGASRR